MPDEQLIHNAAPQPVNGGALAPFNRAEIVTLEQVAHALALCADALKHWETPEQLRAISDNSKLLAEYTRIKEMSVAVRNQATELEQKVKQQMAQFYEALHIESGKGGGGDQKSSAAHEKKRKSPAPGKGASDSTSRKRALKALGVSHQDMSRMKAIADIPEAVVVAYRDDATAAGVLTNDEGLIAYAKAKGVHKPARSTEKRRGGKDGTRLSAADTLLALSEMPQPVTLSDLRRLKQQSDHWLFDIARYIPWVTMKQVEFRKSWNVTVDRELYEICEGKRERPKLNGMSLVAALDQMRREIYRRRKENREKDAVWKPDLCSKNEQAVLLDWVERTVETITAVFTGSK